MLAAVDLDHQPMLAAIQKARPLQTERGRHYRCHHLQAGLA
jgi:hypothetical protein